MSDWVAIINKAQKCLEAGQPQIASLLCREALDAYASDQIAVQWLTFNLMLSEIASRGNKVARAFLIEILKTGLNWNAKLYTLELALGSANLGDSDLDGLYNDTLDVLSRYTGSHHGAEDINIMSCQSVVRHMRRLFPQHSTSLTDLISNEDQYCLAAEVASNPTPPHPLTQCNRRPHVLAQAFDNYIPPERPLGFRHIGKAYILRLVNNTIVFDADGQVLDTPYGAYPRFLKIILEQIFKTLTSRHTLPGPSLFIGDYFAQALNYCHWTIDGLPRIVAADLAGLKINCIIGTFEETTQYQSDTLRLILQPDQTYYGCSPDAGLVSCADLYFADNASLQHVHHPIYGCDGELLEQLKRRLMAKSAPQTPRRRLYIPRRHNRVVLNEPDLIALLMSYGFESVDTDALSFQQQVETFASAEAIVGPHGAAFTNLLFTSTGCKVMEFFPPFGGSDSFYKLSSALNLDYACLIDDLSQGADRDSSNGIVNNTSGIQVDLAFTERWLIKKFGPV